MGASVRTNLGGADLLLYAVAMSVSIRWIASAAAAGPVALPLWGLAILTFGAPLCLVTAELTGRFPEEGGVYAWTEKTFGPFWGFVCGWLYWTCNLPFFAAVVVFGLNILALALGPLGAPLTRPGAVLALSLAVVFAVGLLHWLGLGAGKWLSNLGGASNLAILALLLLCAGVAVRVRGPAADFAPRAWRLPLDGSAALLWATMVFGVGGPEAIAFLRNDVRGGMRTVLIVIALTLLVQAAFFTSGTAAVLALLSTAEVTRLSGLPDAIVAGLRSIGLGGLAALALGVSAAATFGSYSSWFGVAARLPFAAGIDHFLPESFGRRDPRTGAPRTAILVQTLVTAAIVILSQAGSTVRAAYDFLVAMSALTYTLPFALLFAVHLALARRPAPAGAWRIPGPPALVRLVSLVGLASTLLAVACSMAPSPETRDPVGATARLLAANGLLLGAGALVYVLARRRALAARALA